MNDDLDYNCLGCIIRKIKELLLETPINYKYDILEIIIKASGKGFSIEQEQIKRLMTNIELMLQNSDEPFKILAKIEMADLTLDDIVAEHYYQDDKTRFLKGITKKTSQRTRQGQRKHLQNKAWKKY